jgi:hypothetical protein
MMVPHLQAPVAGEGSAAAVRGSSDAELDVRPDAQADGVKGAGAEDGAAARAASAEAERGEVTKEAAKAGSGEEEAADDDEDEDEGEDDGGEKKNRDRNTHSELIKLGAAGAGKGGKIGVWGVYSPGRPQITDPDSRSRIPARLLNAELTCPICLSIVRCTHTFMECMHRFCQECIEKYLRLGQKECPKCRVKVSSRRALRPDPAFDKIIQKFYPDIVSERVRVGN